MKTVQLLKEAQFHGARRIAFARYRVLWAAAFMVLLVCSIIVLFNTIQRYISNPTYIVQEESILRLKPFPNVLIFPEVNFVPEKMNEFLTELKYPEEINRTYVERVLPQLAAFLSPDVEYLQQDLENLQTLLDYNHLDVESVGKRLTASCAEILLRCRWRKKIVNCSNIFHMEITRTGYSCVFNGRSLKREIKEHGIHYVKPGRVVNVSLVGYSNALMVVLDQKNTVLRDMDLDFKWLALQEGQHYVDVGVNGTPVSPGVELWVSHVVRSVAASGDALSLSTSLRKCQLSNEPLELFPIYHESYCLLECEIRRTIERCRCTKISYPEIPGVPLCRADQLLCARKIAVVIVMLTFTVSFQLGECHCPPTCDVNADFLIPQTSTYELDASVYTLDTLYHGLDFEHVSVVRVFIASHNKKIIQRRSYFTNFNLFSQLGGAFNLFFGCSILTLLELAVLMYRWLKDFFKNKEKRKEIFSKTKDIHENRFMYILCLSKRKRNTKPTILSKANEEKIDKK